MPNPITVSVAHVAQVASETLAPGERAIAVLEALQQVVPYDCAELSAWLPEENRHAAIASVGYDDRMLEWLNGCDRVGELDQIDVRASGRPMRLRDLPPHGRSARTVREFLLPAGFGNGLTIGLRTADGRYVGVLDVSTCDPRNPTDLQSEAISLLSGTLANVVDSAQPLGHAAALLPRESFAVALVDGVVVAAPGLQRGPLLCQARVLDAARALVASNRAASRFLWPSDDRRTWWALSLTRCDERRWLISSHRVEVPHDLTRRELEVLTLLASGCSNPEIATTLVISARTVATHVEHILQKLGAPTRAAAAARAVADGILLAA